MKPYNERLPLINQRAKELGYINGYKYGVEYETNGKKPDLPDDIEIEFIRDFMDSFSKTKVGKLCWEGVSIDSPVTKFRIIDDRYKPKEKEMNNNWYERGDLPPSNTECEVRIDGQWLPTVVVGHYAMEVVVVDPCVTVKRFFCTTANNLRPIRTETDKLVEQAMSLFSETESTTDAQEGIEHAVRKLIEAGYRKVKPMSKDEFVQDALKHFSSIRFDLGKRRLICDSLRKLHSAGCRFIDKGGNDE